MLGAVTRALAQNNEKNIQRSVEAITNTLVKSGLDPAMEYEADRLGIAYATLAGYEADALSDFLTRLRSESQTTRSVFLTTHPAIDKRIARITREVLPKYQKHGRRNKERFTTALAPRP